MRKQRVSIPKAISEAVLKEYRHKCAMCGRNPPQIHHIDENPSNNAPENLLPLCPNCHLQDTHDPTSPPDSRKVRLFRKYKDPLILDARFHPIFTRTQFLYDKRVRERPARINYLFTELFDFISELKMGSFYGKRILGRAKHLHANYAIKLEDDGKPTDIKTIAASAELCDAAYCDLTETIKALLVEQLRYQGWTAKAFSDDGQRAAMNS